MMKSPRSWAMKFPTPWPTILQNGCPWPWPRSSVCPGWPLPQEDSVYKGAILSGSSLAAATAITLPNSRTSESEADQMGIELAARAGYDPRAAATLWQKMAKVGGDGPPQFLSTHPSPANRQQRLSVLADQMMVYYRDTSPRPVYPLQ